MKFLATLFGFLDKLFAFINTQQLKKAGRDELKSEQAEVDDVARKKTKENNAAIDALSDDAVVVRMRKWKRKDL